MSFTGAGTLHRHALSPSQALVNPGRVDWRVRVSPIRIRFEAHPLPSFIRLVHSFFSLSLSLSISHLYNTVY